MASLVYSLYEDKPCKSIDIVFARQLSKAFNEYLDFENPHTLSILRRCLSEAIFKANEELKDYVVEYSDSDEEAEPAEEAVPAEETPKPYSDTSSNEDGEHSTNEVVTSQTSETSEPSDLDSYIELFTNINSKEKENVFDFLNEDENIMDIVLWHFFDSTYLPLYDHMRYGRHFIANNFPEIGPELRQKIIDGIYEEKRRKAVLQQIKQAVLQINNKNGLRLRF